MNAIESYEDRIVVRYHGVDHEFHAGDRKERLEITALVKFRDGSGALRKGCLCRCDCGDEVGPIRLVSLLNGDNRSCGCAAREIHRDVIAGMNFKHGQSVRGKRSRLYALWAAMTDRARNTVRKDSVYYARKLGSDAVDPDWLDFAKFAAWAEANGYREGLSIDRIENDKGYGPGNCRFIDLKEQNRNKTSNRWFEWNGEQHLITDWIRLLGLHSSTVYRRLRRGLSVGQALGLE